MTENTKDYLKKDPPMPGQDWAVVSFVSPKDMVAMKNLYYANRFLVSDVNKTIGAQATQMAKFIGVKMRNQIESVLDKLSESLDDDDRRVHEILKKKYEQLQIDEDEFVHECRRKYELDDDVLLDKFKMYVTENRLEMDKSFDQAHDHATSVRGFKVRGGIGRLEDAKERAKMLRDFEPAIHTFVVPMGYWFPVDMEADEAQEQEHMLPELNDFMGKYYQNIQSKNAHFKERERSLAENKTIYNKGSNQSRLQEKLSRNRATKMKKELEDMKQKMSGDVGTLVEKKKRRRRKNKKVTKTKPDTKTEISKSGNESEDIELETEAA